MDASWQIIQSLRKVFTMNHSHEFNFNEVKSPHQRNLGPFSCYQLKSDLNLEERIFLFCEVMRQGLGNSHLATHEPLGLKPCTHRHKPGSGDGGTNMSVLSERY